MTLPLPDVCDLNRFSLDQALAAARQRLLERPTYDLQISRFFTQYLNTNDVQLRIVERTVELLSEISPAARLLTVLRAAMECENQHIRSKAALSLGRKVESIALLQKLISDSDARVRANTVEALWGRRTTEIASIFQKALSDAHHRVAANAAYGLFLASDKGYAAYIETFTTHVLPGHRAAGAWLVGKIGDTQNSKFLKPLLVDANEMVRKAAFQAITALRTAATTPSAA